MNTSLCNVPIGWLKTRMFVQHLECPLTFSPQICPSQWMFTVIGSMPVKQPINSHVFPWLPFSLASLTYISPLWLVCWIRSCSASTNIRSTMYSLYVRLLSMTRSSGWARGSPCCFVYITVVHVKLSCLIFTVAQDVFPFFGLICHIIKFNLISLLL